MAKASGMMAAVAAAAGMGDEPVSLTAALVAEHFPAIAAEIRAEGATAERARIAGIEAQSLPGHEALVAAHKADGTRTGADTAMAIVAAEKTTRKAMLASLDADEAKMKGLRSEPANGSEPPINPQAGLSGEALWKSQYAGDAKVSSEFTSEANYLAFKRAEARGGVRILKNSRA